MDTTSPAPRDRSRKLGLFACLAAALLQLALHNPLSGYVTSEERFGLRIPGIILFACEDGWTHERDGERFVCEDGRQVKALPLSQWHTQGPATPWLGKLGNLLALLLADALAALAWLGLFRQESR